MNRIEDESQSQPAPIGTDFLELPKVQYRVLGLLFLTQLIAFFAFLDREILWAHCFSFDQATFLYRAYADFEVLLTKGIQAAIVSSLSAPIPNGMILPLEATLLFAIFGAHRKVALGLLLFHWLVCQWTFFLAGKKLGNSAKWGFAAVGLLLSIQAPMAFLGGLFDFRFDGAALSVMGIVAALIVLSDGLQDRKMTLFLAIAAVYAILVRHITVVYIAGGIGVYGALLVLLMLSRSDSAARRQLAPRLINLFRLGVIFGTGAMLLILVKFRVLYEYYIAGHLFSSEKEVRAAESGVVDSGRYTYYLNSIVNDQLGYPTLVLFGVLASWCLVGRLLGSRQEKPVWYFRNEIHALFFLLSIVSVTYAVLSYDIAKTPIVANVFCGPLVVVVLLLAFLFGRPAAPTFPRVLQFWIHRFPLLIFGAGCLLAYVRYARHTPLWSMEPAIQEIRFAHEKIGTYARSLPDQTALLFSDRNTDYQIAMAMVVEYYEQHGHMISLSNPVEGNVMLGDADWPRLRDDLLRSDIAFITEELQEGEATAVYPTTRMLSKHKQEIVALANEHLIRTASIKAGDHRLGLYVRRRIEFSGDSGGWITSAGIRLALNTQWLTARKTLVLEGAAPHPQPLRGMLGGRAAIVSTGRELPVSFSPLTSNYRIEVDLRSIDTSKPEDFEILITFDRFFVPRKEGISADDRQLVVGAPRMITLVTEPKLTQEKPKVPSPIPPR